MFVEEAAKLAANELLKHKKSYFALLDDLYKRVRDGQQNIYIFGAGGTGKTTLANILEGKEHVGSITGEYDLSEITHETDVKERRFKNVWTAPGQSVFRNEEWGDLADDLKSKKNTLLINIVSYGYLSVQRSDVSEIDEFKKNGVNKDTIRDLLKNARIEETQAIKELVDYTRNIKSVKMITVITKQDLWWKDRAKVKGHYEKTSPKQITDDTLAENSTYQDHISRLRRAVGEKNMKHIVTSVSFGNINFKTKDGHLIQETTGGYDAGLLHANFAQFAKTLDQFIR